MPYLLAVLAGFVVCLAALVSVSGLLALVVVSAAFGYVAHSMFHAIDTYLLDSLPDESRGSAYAVYSSGMMVVQAGGPSVVGALREAGYAFDTVFAVGTADLGGILVVLVGARWLGVFPE